MLNPSDSAQNIKRYLKKLLRLIEHDAVFSLFKCTLVNKNKVDDIICCVEGSFPNEYKDYVKKMGPKGLRTYGLWIQILKDIKKPILSIFIALFSTKSQCYTRAFINDSKNRF